MSRIVNWKLGIYSTVFREVKIVFCVNIMENFKTLYIL